MLMSCRAFLQIFLWIGVQRIQSDKSYVQESNSLAINTLVINYQERYVSFFEKDYTFL
jgi:hypothetical protein